MPKCKISLRIEGKIPHIEELKSPTRFLDSDNRKRKMAASRMVQIWRESDQKQASDCCALSAELDLMDD